MTRAQMHALRRVKKCCVTIQEIGYIGRGGRLVTTRRHLIGRCRAIVRFLARSFPHHWDEWESNRLARRSENPVADVRDPDAALLRAYMNTLQNLGEAVRSYLRAAGTHPMDTHAGPPAFFTAILDAIRSACPEDFDHFAEGADLELFPPKFRAERGEPPAGRES